MSKSTNLFNYSSKFLDNRSKGKWMKSTCSSLRHLGNYGAQWDKPHHNLHSNNLAFLFVSYTFCVKSIIFSIRLKVHMLHELDLRSSRIEILFTNKTAPYRYEKRPWDLREKGREATCKWIPFVSGEINISCSLQTRYRSFEIFKLRHGSLVDSMWEQVS